MCELLAVDEVHVHSNSLTDSTEDEMNNEPVAVKKTFADNLGLRNTLCDCTRTKK